MSLVPSPSRLSTDEATPDWKRDSVLISGSCSENYQISSLVINYRELLSKNGFNWLDVVSMGLRLLNSLRR